MQNDQTTQDAKRLLVALSTNHPEARVASPSAGMDRPFSPSWADAEQAGLDRVRRDAAMWWLIDNNLLEREVRITITFTALCSGSVILGGSCWRRSGRNKGINKCSLRRSSSRVGASPTPLR
jgi:hypothetical protein